MDYLALLDEALAAGDAGKARRVLLAAAGIEASFPADPPVATDPPTAALVARAQALCQEDPGADVAAAALVLCLLAAGPTEALASDLVRLLVDPVAPGTLAGAVTLSRDGCRAAAALIEGYATADPPWPVFVTRLAERAAGFAYVRDALKKPLKAYGKATKPPKESELAYWLRRIR